VLDAQRSFFERSLTNPSGAQGHVVQVLSTTTE